MPAHRRGSSRGRIRVDGLTSSLSQKLAASFAEVTERLEPPHAREMASGSLMTSGSIQLVDQARYLALTSKRPLDASRHVDGDAGDEVGVAGGEEADHPRLIARLGHASERRAEDLLRLLLRRPLLPPRSDPLRQRHAGRDRVHGDAEGPQLLP